MEISLSEITNEDFPVIKEIYDHYILNTFCTYHINEISIKDLKENILVGHSKYKSFLIKSENVICGYCYLSQYKKRQAYDRTAELTIYLKNEFTGRGIGKFVLKKMDAIASNAGIKVLIGIISGENLVSQNLFEKCGYSKNGHLKEVGEKFGKIIDILFYQKILDK